MRKALFIIAFVILANPLLSNIDILPDFIAYILIMIALSKASYISTQAYSAYNSSRNMLVVSLLKLASMYLSIVIVDDTISLVFSFVFLIIELIFGIPFILKLYEYFSVLAINNEKGKLAGRIDIFKIIMIAILSIQLVLATLPDFLLLTRQDPYFGYGIDYSVLRRPLMVVFFILAIPLMIAWIVLACNIFKKLFTKEIEKSINDEFDVKIENKRLHYEIKAVTRVLLAVGLSLVFAFEVKVDNINVFYNSIIPVAFIVCYLYLKLRGFIKINKLFYVLCGVTALQLTMRIIEAVRMKEYFKIYNLESVFFRSQAETMYYTTIMFTAMSSILFAVCVSLMIYLLIDMADKSLKKNLPAVFHSGDFDYSIKEYRRRVRPFGIITTALALASSSFYPLMVALFPYNEELIPLTIGNKTINLPFFSWFMPISVVLTFAFVVMLVVTLVIINENTYKKLYSRISLD